MSELLISVAIVAALIAASAIWIYTFIYYYQIKKINVWMEEFFKCLGLCSIILIIVIFTGTLLAEYLSTGHGYGNIGLAPILFGALALGIDGVVAFVWGIIFYQKEKTTKR